MEYLNNFVKYDLDTEAKSTSLRLVWNSYEHKRRANTLEEFLTITEKESMDRLYKNPKNFEASWDSNMLLLAQKKSTNLQFLVLKPIASGPSVIEELNLRITWLSKIRDSILQVNKENSTSKVTAQIETQNEKFLSRFKEYIYSNLANSELNITTIKNEMNMSRTQLHRKVKSLTGLSTTEFIRTIRLKRASELIKRNVDSITQIGYQTGFSDHSYFSKCFKKQYGISPSIYSKKYSSSL